MQRKITPCSHPFHALLLRPASWLLLSVILPFSGIGSTLFHIECPPDVTVDCNDELWDLSIYGNATVYGYGDPQSAGPPISVDYNLNNCNLGTIVRTWVAYDYGGHPYYCSQTITVGGFGGYVDIHWPPDFTIHACNPETAPDALPPPYDHPVFEYGGDCSQLLTNYEDLVFNINPPACIKILRKWTVVDWCIFDPHSYDPQGIWTYTQIIKITPQNPPIIWCPADTVVSAGADCSGGHVELPPAFGSSDCGAGVTITNNSPYAYSHGANASGNYPLGTTKVTFWADDGCGQKVSCSMYITVKDLKKPTPICYYGITVTLMQMPDGYYMDLRPSFFNKGSFDNCTPKNELKMWVEPSRVGCEELGATAVRLYVEDESGNIEYCNTLVYVQDNLGICPPDDGIVDGTIYSTNGHALDEVKVSVQGASEFSMTDTEGFYAFPSLPFGKSYTLTPGYPEDDLAGVTTIDMVALLKHILGVEALSSPYQFIAADMDRSGRVSVSDLLAVKDIILKEYYGLNPKTTWRFIDANYTFENSADPLSESFPESYQIPILTANMTDLDFVGVKLGDINGDSKANFQGSHTIMSRGSGIDLLVPDINFKKGETYEITVSVSEYEELQAMQVGLETESAIIEIIGAEPCQLSHGLDIINRTLEYHVITALWYGVEPLSAPELFKVKFHALQGGKLSDALSIHPDSHALAYKKGASQPSKIALHFGDALPSENAMSSPNQVMLKVGQNYPNPFSLITTLPVDLAEAGLIEIEILNVNGQRLFEFSHAGVKGLQEITIHTEDIGATGVVICRITASNDTQTVRMVIRSGA